MVCWPKDVWTKLENEEDKAFLMSMQSDRTATMVSRDMKTYNLENRKRKRKEAESKLILSEKERRDEAIPMIQVYHIYQLKKLQTSQHENTNV